MKKAIILVLVYYLLQMVCSIAAMAILALTGQEMDFGDVVSLSLLLSIVGMMGILWAMGCLNGGRPLWRIGSMPFMGWTVALGLSFIVLSDLLSNVLSFMPDLLESSFSAMESSWMGIVAVALLGPLLEEMLFRGVVTKELLARYPAGKAILYSALIFGVFHLNPAQVVTASFTGLLLAWLYYRTRSLVPGLVVHVMNNSLSVYLSLNYPNADSLMDVTGRMAYTIYILVAVFIVAAAVRHFVRRTVQ